MSELDVATPRPGGRSGHGRTGLVIVYRTTVGGDAWAWWPIRSPGANGVTTPSPLGLWRRLGLVADPVTCMAVFSVAGIVWRRLG